jgi:energy-converting hydrogenase B subunit D
MVGYPETLSNLGAGDACQRDFLSSGGAYRVTRERSSVEATMTTTAWLFDGFLAASLLWLAWRLLTTPNLFRAVVLFIVFGLLMALTWARLNAPDVALAEAAVGAGITGALFLDALGRLGGIRQTGNQASNGGPMG